MFAAARVEAGLPDDTEIRVLAHRRQFGVGYAAFVLHVFLQDQDPSYAPDTAAGVVDEAAWQELTGSARTRQIWMVR